MLVRAYPSVQGIIISEQSGDNQVLVSEGVRGKIILRMQFLRRSCRNLNDKTLINVILRPSRLYA
jgi:hypothetical protein